MKKILTLISYTAILLVVAMGAMLLVSFINNGQKNFYVEYDDQKISYKKENLILPKDKYSLFFCKNIFGITKATESVKHYSVRIEANPENINDFDFTVDGATCSFYGMTGKADVTPAFIIHKYDGYFMLVVPSDLTMQKILQSLYPNQTVADVPDINFYEKDCFNLLVTSEEESAVITIGFH